VQLQQRRTQTRASAWIRASRRRGKHDKRRCPREGPRRLLLRASGSPPFTVRALGHCASRANPEADLCHLRLSPLVGARRGLGTGSHGRTPGQASDARRPRVDGRRRTRRSSWLYLGVAEPGLRISPRRGVDENRRDRSVELQLGRRHSQIIPARVALVPDPDLDD